MRIWRISTARYEDTALSGIGASLVPGRWNKTGQPVVYCSSSLALATLEVLVHLDDSNVQINFDYVAIEIDVHDRCVQSIGSRYDALEILSDIQISRQLG